MSNTSRQFMFSLAYAMAVSLIGSVAHGQTLAAKVADKYRRSMVYLSVNKITNTGEVVTEGGTGFVISDKGHVLTSCHVIDRRIITSDGTTNSTAVDTVEVRGAMSSRNAPLEPMSVLRCSSDIDLALIKFKNTALARTPIPVSSASGALGDPIAAMGFPKELDFFTRNGTLSGDADNDLLSVDMTLNPGDSGGPVLDGNLRVVAVTEGGFAGSGIGVVRPIRHAALLLIEAGAIQFAAINAQFNSSPAPLTPENANIEVAAASTAIKAFAAAASKATHSAVRINVAYPVATRFSAQGVGDTSGQANLVALKDYAAQPGYKIIDSKFIITAQDGVKVLPVTPTADGLNARLVAIKSDALKDDPNSPNVLRGFLQTVQVKDIR